MSDHYGALAIPVAAPAAGSAPGDPALTAVLGYLRGFINEHVATCWGAVTPGGAPVKSVLAYNPAEAGLNDIDLPALYAWRSRGRPNADETSDSLFEEATLTLQWVFPTSARPTQWTRDPFVNAIMKAAQVAILRGRCPEWASAGDTDPTAASRQADPDAIKTATATSTSPVTYEDADLDGVLGEDEFAPTRALTLTTTAAAGAYNTTDPIEVTYLDWSATEVVASFTLTDEDGGETITLPTEAAQVTGIDVPAQALTTGTLAFGVAAFEGRGSVLLRVAGFDRLRITDWRPKLLTFKVDGGTVRGPYEAVEATLVARELLIQDVDDPTLSDANDSHEAGIVHEDGTALGSLFYST